MDEIQFENQEAADRAFRANTSPRYRTIEKLERYVNGTQYEGLPNWWSDEVPLWERAPCVVYPVVDIAISSYVDLLLGQGRFPEFTTKQGENEADEENGLGPEDSGAIDRVVREWHRHCKFRSLSRDMLEHAMGCRSAAVIHGVRNGRPFADLVPAKWAEPKLDQEGAVLSLEIRYPYQEQYKDQRTGKWAVRTKIYRRVIDAERDIEFLPADATEQGTEPEWRENKARTIEHKLGYCPVVWYPFLRGCVPVNVVDGHAIQERITDEIFAHDLARSQWHRGALFSEPQPYEINVPPGFNPTESGVLPRVVSTEKGGTPSPNNPVTGAFIDPGDRRKTARKRGPGYVWQYPDKAQVGVLTYPAEALKAQEDNCRDLRIKLQEALAVVFLDPESIKFAATTSGKALEAIKQKQLDRCDKIRDDLAERYFEPSVSMQLRIAHTLLSRGQRLNVPGAAKAKPILDKFFTAAKSAKGDTGEDVMVEPARWQIPTLQTKWGTYFAPDVAEQKILIEMVLLAIEAGIPLITVKIALQKLAPIFGIENVTAFMEELKKEQAERAKVKSDEDRDAMREAMKQLDGSRRAGGPNSLPGSRGPGAGARRPGQAAPNGSV